MTYLIPYWEALGDTWSLMAPSGASLSLFSFTRAFLGCPGAPGASCSSWVPLVFSGPSCRFLGPPEGTLERPGASWHIPRPPGAFCGVLEPPGASWAPLDPFGACLSLLGIPKFFLGPKTYYFSTNLESLWSKLEHNSTSKKTRK